MAQPTPYTRIYDFIGWQTANPTRPLPAAQAEAEWNAIMNTLDEVLAVIKLIQRDDGLLGNLSVGLDQLAPEVVTALGLGDVLCDVNVQSFGTDVTLVTANMSLTNIMTPTTSGLYVNMPTTAGMRENYRFYFVNPSTAYEYSVKDSSGGVIVTVPRESAAIVVLTDTSTASGSWAVIEPGDGGITTPVVVSQATDYTITQTIRLTMSVAFSASAKAVILPSALGKKTGGPWYRIKNDGATRFYIKDYAGTIISEVWPGCSCYVFLFANGTTAGTWSVDGGTAYLSGIISTGTVGAEVEVDASMDYLRCGDGCGAGANRGTVCYSKATSAGAPAGAMSGFTRAVSLSGSTMTFTAADVIAAATGIYDLAIAYRDDNNSMGAFIDSAYSAYDLHVNTNPPTVTKDQVATFNSWGVLASMSVDMCNHGPAGNMLVVAASDAGIRAGITAEHLVSTSGTAINPETGAACSDVTVDALSQSVAIALWNVGGAGAACLMKNTTAQTVAYYDEAGNASDFYQWTADDVTLLDVVAVSSTKALVFYKNGSEGDRGEVRIVTIDPVALTFSFGAATVFDSIEVGSISAKLMDSSKILLVWQRRDGVANALYGREVELVAGAITMQSPFVINDTQSDHAIVAKLNNLQACVAYHDGTSLKARLVTIG